MLTQEELKRLFFYDEIVGVFIRKTSCSIITGNRHNNGYVTIYINCKKYKAHRLAWLYVYGEMPESDIDHIDMNRKNNSISNLRLCNNAQNQANIKPRNALGVKGVFKVGKKYMAETKVDGKRFKLGRFYTVEDAKAAYDAFCFSVRGEFHRP